MNPSKTAAQVNSESLEGKGLYKVSHNDFDVGEFRNIFESTMHGWMDGWMDIK